MAHRCPSCNCERNFVTNTWTHHIRYNGRVREMVRRRRVCEHCEGSFFTRDFVEDKEPTPEVSPVNPLYTREFLTAPAPPENPFL